MQEIGLIDIIKGERLNSPKTLTRVAMLIALYTILSFFTLNISTEWEISFAFVALCVCGAMFGAVPAGIAGAVGDVLGFFVSPNGAFFPGFTLSAFIMGFLYGLILYKKPLKLTRVIIAEAIVVLICNLILTPTWLNMMYGTDLIAIPRIIRNITLYPVHVTLIYMVLKGTYSFKNTTA